MPTFSFRSNENDNRRKKRQDEWPVADILTTPVVTEFLHQPSPPCIILQLPMSPSRLIHKYRQHNGPSINSQSDICTESFQMIWYIESNACETS